MTFLCSRRRSNVVRWVIAIPFSLTIVAYDVIRLPQMLERQPVLFFVLLRARPDVRRHLHALYPTLTRLVCPQAASTRYCSS